VYYIAIQPKSQAKCGSFGSFGGFGPFGSEDFGGFLCGDLAKQWV